MQGLWAGIPLLLGCTHAADPVPLPPPPPHSPDLILVAHYHPDPRCEVLVRSPLRVPRDRAIYASIEAVLQSARSPDLDIQSYRLTLDPAHRRAYIALRFHPDRDRPWSSLSPCEHLTLFGSLRDTLTRNSAWEVDQVEFQHLDHLKN